MENSKINKKIWVPGDILFCGNNSSSYAVVILNVEIQFDKNVLLPVWNKAAIRATVDGGTDRLLKWLVDNEITKIKNLNFISGDFDSISALTLNKFKEFQNPVIIKTPNQNETDFTKSLRQLKCYSDTENIQLEYILAISESSGRIDQIMANINSLYYALDIFPDIPVYIYAHNSLSWLLTPGKHEIRISNDLLNMKSWCSLVPMSGKTKVSTNGLKWNLDNTYCEFGNLVSTSNKFSGKDLVKIDTDNYLFWSIGTKLD